MFPYVYVIDLPFGYTNSLIYGSPQPVTVSKLKQRMLAADNPNLHEVASRPWTIRTIEETTQIYTDDLAPVERLIDDIIVREAISDSFGRQR